MDKEPVFENGRWTKCWYCKESTNLYLVKRKYDKVPVCKGHSLNAKYL